MDDSEDEWLDVPEQDPGVVIEGEEALLEGDDSEEQSFPSELQGGQEEPFMVPLHPTANESIKARRVPSKKEREEKMDLHKAHLLLWLVHGRVRNRWCNSDSLQSTLRKMLPPEILELADDRSRTPITLTSLKTLVSWWNKNFKREPEAGGEVGKLDFTPGELSGPEFLSTILQERKGPLSALVLLFVGLCRLLGFLTRLVVSLQPVSFRFSLEELSNGPNSPPPLENPAKKPKVAETPTLYWCEVYSTDEARWIAIDLEQSKVDDPYCLEPLLGSQYPLRYVIGIQGDQMIKDVTRRYSGHWGAKTKRLRMPEIFWWTNVLERFHPRFGREFDRNRDEWEDSELDAREKTEILPKTFDEFKRHPLYALERHLRKTEALRSKEIVLGHFRGEPVYPRSEVKTLRSSLAWMKLARVVIAGETPIKLIKSRTLSKGKKEGDTENAPQSQETPLFGFWQTQPYSTRAAKNGVVPKNQFGRVDLYQNSMLPEGTVHVTYPGAKDLARRFGIDYAEAVVSIDFNRGRMVPKVEGVVICKEHEEIITEALAEKDRIRREKERKTKEQEALMRWKKLTQGLLLRDRLMKKYGVDSTEKSKK